MSEWNKHKKRNEQIRRLRREGHTIKEIVSVVGCAKSVVSYHCKNIEITPRVRRKQMENKTFPHQHLGFKSASKRWNQLKNSVREQAVAEWESVRTDPLMMSFLGLYWGDGHKRAGAAKTSVVGVTNNDYYFILAAYQCLVKLTDKVLTASITYYPSHDKDECREFWSKLLPEARIKMYSVKDQRISPSEEILPCCQYGRCTLRVSDWALWHKIMSWLDCWKKDLGAVAQSEEHLTVDQEVVGS